MPDRRSAVAALVLGAAFWPSSATAQVPDRFTNLQVLPDDTPRAELVKTMRGWAGGLGVQCHYCHVGPENLQGMDFASDEKPAKRAAREMLRMTRAINGQFLKALPDTGDERREVTCYTCHRHQTRPPRFIVDEFLHDFDRRGVEAAMDHYRELREQRYGAGEYDFDPGRLVYVAQTLLERGQPEAATATLDLAAEYGADAAAVTATRGHLLLAKGDAAGSRALFERALELDPENWEARVGLRKLQQQEH